MGERFGSGQDIQNLLGSLVQRVAALEQSTPGSLGGGSVAAPFSIGGHSFGGSAESIDLAVLTDELGVKPGFTAEFGPVGLSMPNNTFVVPTCVGTVDGSGGPEVGASSWTIPRDGVWSFGLTLGVSGTAPTNWARLILDRAAVGVRYYTFEADFSTGTLGGGFTARCRAGDSVTQIAALQGSGSGQTLVFLTVDAYWLGK